MFWSYLGLLLSGLLFIGTGLGSLLLGLALAVHAASIVDVVASRVLDFRRRLAYSGAALFMLAVVVYYPAVHLLGLVANPQRFELAAPPFDAGDVVLVNPSAYRWSDPQPGDVVQYGRAPQDLRTRGPGAYATIYRLQGDRIDRILARGGDRVTCDQGRLLVNGEPSPWLPLDPRQLPDVRELTVPENCYLILPSADALVFGGSGSLQASYRGGRFWDAFTGARSRCGGSGPFADEETLDGKIRQAGIQPSQSDLRPSRARPIRWPATPATG